MYLLGKYCSCGVMMWSHVSKNKFLKNDSFRNSFWDDFELNNFKMVLKCVWGEGRGQNSSSHRMRYKNMFFDFLSSLEMLFHQKWFQVGLDFTQNVGKFRIGYQSASFQSPGINFWGNFELNFKLISSLLGLLLFCLHSMTSKRTRKAIEPFSLMKV